MSAKTAEQQTKIILELLRDNWKPWGSEKEESRKEYLKKYSPIIRARMASAKYKQRLRMAAIGALGGRCVKCGFTDIRALQIDHIDGGGNKLRDKNGGYYVTMYKEIVSGCHPEKIQLLCANCNWIKREENREMYPINERNNEQ